VALHKMKAHLLYISEDLAGLSLFSDKVLADEKKQMVSALCKLQNKAHLRRIDPKTMKTFQEQTLSAFVTQRSMHLFTTLEVSQNFLGSDAEMWNS